MLQLFNSLVHMDVKYAEFSVVGRMNIIGYGIALCLANISMKNFILGRVNKFLD